MYSSPVINNICIVKIRRELPKRSANEYTKKYTSTIHEMMIPISMPVLKYSIEEDFSFPSGLPARFRQFWICYSRDRDEYSHGK